jgi:sialic acid synthase SpsE
MDKNIKIIAEIGINHNGDFEQALSLIQAALDAGVWGVKFQYRNLDNAYAEGANQIGDEMLLEEIKRNYLAPQTILSLVSSAKEMGLKVGISFFDVRDIDDFEENISDFDFFKTPSVELLNSTLNNSLLALGKPLYLSLGCHSEAEIDQALQSLANDNWLAMHCISNYPVSLSNARLGYLKHMSAKWGKPFGFSSHDESWEVTLLAMSMGASVIERHITFDKMANGLDHTTSSTPDEFSRMVMFAEHMPLLMSGDHARVPNQGELLNLQNLGRSYYAKHQIGIGEVVTEDSVVLRSPRIGMGQSEATHFFSQPTARKVSTGEVLSRSVFTDPEKVNDDALQFAKKHRISIPVRLHDLSTIENKFPIGTYEFHLSFREVLSELDVEKYSGSNEYSIHLPDYINPTQLMDPFSADLAQSRSSLDILDRTVSFAEALQDKTGKAVPIVGSFSVVHKNIDEFYSQHAELLSQYKKRGVSILPQWLPPIAWYFGGSVKLEVVNQPRDVELIQQYELPICMDVCHLCMGDSVFDFDALETINKLASQIEHIHIADAAGVDGEGLQFGDGDPKNLAAIEAAMKFDSMKVIEVWQGHLDNGAGFAKALNRIYELFNGRI